MDNDDDNDDNNNNSNIFLGKYKKCGDNMIFKSHTHIHVYVIVDVQ
jgi:hypothetical protein